MKKSGLLLAAGTWCPAAPSQVDKLFNAHTERHWPATSRQSTAAVATKRLLYSVEQPINRFDGHDEWLAPRKNGVCLENAECNCRQSSVIVSATAQIEVV